MNLKLYLLLSKSHELGGFEFRVSTLDGLVVLLEYVAVNAEQKCRPNCVLGVGSISHMNETA